MTMNCSARCIRKRLKRFASTLSNSSLCLILTEMRQLFTDGSISTASVAEREIVTGFSSSSLLPLPRHEARIFHTT